MDKNTLCVSALLMAALFGAVNASWGSSSLTLPKEQEATDAILTLMDMPEYADKAHVKLGTCVAVPSAKHPGQIACTVGVHIGAGTSETQADFYRNGDTWVAQPSESQDLLPFPDPKID